MPKLNLSIRAETRTALVNITIGLVFLAGGVGYCLARNMPMNAGFGWSFTPFGVGWMSGFLIGTGIELFVTGAGLLRSSLKTNEVSS